MAKRDWFRIMMTPAGEVGRAHSDHQVDPKMDHDAPKGFNEGGDHAKVVRCQERH